MSEIENLLNELRNMKANSNNDPSNTKDFWKKIKNNMGFQDLGFTTEEEFKSWMLANPYANII